MAAAAGLTFLGGVPDDDLPASFAGLLHGQRRAEALLVLPQALAFLEAVLLHDLMGHGASGEQEGEEKDAVTLQTLRRPGGHLSLAPPPGSEG